MEKETISIGEFETLKAENLMLKMELANLKKIIFGSKTERYVSKNIDPSQGSLFPQPEPEKLKKKQKNKKPPVSKKTKKQKKRRPKVFLKV